MRIALDYDGTYTADPGLFDKFVQLAKAAGHSIVCVTMRRPDEAISMPCDVIYTSRRAKLGYLAEKGVPIDVWIDDKPHWLFQDG